MLGEALSARQDEPGEQSGQEEELRDQIDVGGGPRPQEFLPAYPESGVVSRAPRVLVVPGRELTW